MKTNLYFYDFLDQCVAFSANHGIYILLFFLYGKASMFTRRIYYFILDLHLKYLNILKYKTDHDKKYISLILDHVVINVYYWQFPVSQLSKKKETDINVEN